MEDTPASPEDLETFRQEIAVYYRRQLNQRDASKMYNDRCVISVSFSSLTDLFIHS